MAGFVLWMYRECKYVFLLVVIMSLAASAVAGPMTIERFEGDVQVRRGVAEEWTGVVAGLQLRPEDTIRTGKNAFAVLRRGDATYRIPEESTVDVSGFRVIDREELLLLLAMEDMLAVPDRIDDDSPIPQTTVLHGSPRAGAAGDAVEVDPTTAEFRINGAKFLIDQNYRGAAVLKIRETLRLYPEGAYRIGAMMAAAESLESLELFEEAARYYKTVLDESTDNNIRRIAETRLDRIEEMKD